MRAFLRFLRPMAYARRKAVYAGVLGGSRKWLIWGGAAWIFHWLGRLFSGGEPLPRYTREVGPGERVVVVHEPMGALSVKRQASEAAKKEKKAAKAEARAAKKAAKRS